MTAQDFSDAVEFVAEVAARFSKLVDKRTVFYGRGPFDPWALRELCPPACWADVVNDGDTNHAESMSDIEVLVLGSDTVTDEGFESLVAECVEGALVLSQTGFLALALFGEDWWNDARPDRSGRGDMAHPFDEVRNVLMTRGALWWREQAAVDIAGNEDEPDDEDTADPTLDDDEDDEVGEVDDDEDSDDGDDDDWVPDPVSIPYRPLDHPEPHPTGADTNFRNTTVIRGKYGYQVTGMTETQRWHALAAAVAGEGLEACCAVAGWVR